MKKRPPPFLPDGMNERLVEASRRLLTAVDYVGVATCEFLLTDDGGLWFLEVNPRLQVEHCVSEEVTGSDLVDIQLTIAAGAPLPTIAPVRGHSLELRITCEDPARDLTPSTGTITRLRWPSGPGLRIDSGVVEGDTITPLFDPMLAKIIITGATRDQAIRRARRALSEMIVKGVTVCTALHEHVLSCPEFTVPADRAILGITTRWNDTDVLERLRTGHPDTSDPSPNAYGPGSAASHSRSPISDVASASPRTRSTYVIEVNRRRVQVTIPDGVLGSHGPRMGGRYPGAPTRSHLSGHGHHVRQRSELIGLRPAYGSTAGDVDFCNDNAPVLQVRTSERYFSFTVRTQFDSQCRFDQCGIAVYFDSENWLKASIEYENDSFQRLGSVVTNMGYSDWATTNISSDITHMWYRLSRRESDGCIERSSDGVEFR